MKIIRIVFGFILGITSISLITIGVYNLTKGTSDIVLSQEVTVYNIETTSSFYDLTIEKTENIDIEPPVMWDFLQNLDGSIKYDKIKYYHNDNYITDLVNYNWSQNRVTLKGFEDSQNYIMMLESNPYIAKVEIDTGLELAINDTIRIDIIKYGKQPILSGSTAILIGLIPLLFVGGVIVNRYNNMEF